MSTELKLHLGRKVIDVLSTSAHNCSPAQLLPFFQIKKCFPASNNFELNLPLELLGKYFDASNINKVQNIKTDDLIKDVTISNSDNHNNALIFRIDRNIFTKKVLQSNSKISSNFEPKSIVIDFSSPNVAKPFHMGHLRSTIIGNFVGNLNIFLGNNVTKLNYLGDWGTQFGFVKVGVDELKYTTEEIQDEPMKLLYNSYVYANKLGEGDPQILKRAREEFNKLENGIPNALGEWKRIVDFSKIELESIYERLGVKFDVYNYESMYSAEKIKDIVDILVKKRIVEEESGGKLVAKITEDQSVTVMKSDGSTLYLTRDIAAAIDRFERYKFDKMFYVVDNSQSGHFSALKHILSKMELSWYERLNHVKYGRIHGMSSRKGKGVFLKDLLDECKELMIKKQIDSPTTKISVENSSISDVLSVSCIILNDLKQRRQKDYDFNLDKILQVQGDSGVKLQYTHCRLCNIEKNSGATSTNECVPELLEQPEVTVLIREIARFHEVLHEANKQMEACILVTYLFHLCNYVNKAIKVLNVKNANSDVASQRLLLFQRSREVLGEGMRILGMQPLTEM